MEIPDADSTEVKVLVEYTQRKLTDTAFRSGAVEEAMADVMRLLAEHHPTMDLDAANYIPRTASAEGIAQAILKLSEDVMANLEAIPRSPSRTVARRRYAKLLLRCYTRAFLHHDGFPWYGEKFQENFTHPTPLAAGAPDRARTGRMARGLVDEWGLQKEHAEMLARAALKAMKMKQRAEDEWRQFEVEISPAWGWAGLLKRPGEQ